MPEILVVGLAVVDMVFNVETMPQRAEKYVADDACMAGGGGAANAAVALARLGAQATLLARTADDWFGRNIIDDLQSHRVDCTLLQQTPGAKSAFSSVLVDSGGERQIVNFRGSGLSDQVPSLAGVQVDAVLADTRWLNATVAALSRAKELGVPGVLDAEAPVPQAAVELASHVAFSAQGLTDYTGIANLEEALLAVEQSIDGFVCTTDGQNAVLIVEGGQVTGIPVYSIDAVDTLGAGDVWHAAFTWGLSNKQNAKQAVQFANAAAAMKCQRKGGGRMSPTLTEVQHFIQQRKAN